MHGQLVAEQAKDRLLGEQLEVAKAEVARAQGQIDDTLEGIEASQKLIGRIARSTYQDGGMGELAVVLQSQSPDEFASRLVLVQNAMRSEGNVLSGLAEARADLAAQRATLVAKRKLVAGMKRQQEALVEKIAGLEAQAIDAQQAVESLIAERESGRRRDREGEGGRGGALQRDAGRVRVDWAASSPPGRAPPGSRQHGPGRQAGPATAPAAVPCRSR